MRVMLLLFSLESADKLSRRLTWIGKLLAKAFFNVKYDLRRAELPIGAEQYLTASFFSALAYGLFFSAFFTALFFVKTQTMALPTLALCGGLGVLFFLLFLEIHAMYPALLAQQVASNIDRNLLFALKSMLVQISSGVSLYDSMVHVSRGNYGVVSKEFAAVVQEISTGFSEKQALEGLALKTKSEYLKRTCWQLVTAMQSGSSLQGALNSVVTVLLNFQLRSIKDYAAELNLWLMLYLLLAAAVPTLGITFLVILSSLSGASIGPTHLYQAVIGSFLLQAVLIGFIKTRVPRVYL